MCDALQNTAGFVNWALNCSFLAGVTLSLFLLSGVSERRLLLICLPVLALSNVTFAASVYYGQVSGRIHQDSRQSFLIFLTRSLVHVATLVLQSNKDSYVPAAGIGTSLVVFGFFFSVSLERISSCGGALITPLEALDAVAASSVFVMNLLYCVFPPVFQTMINNWSGAAMAPCLVCNLLFFVVFWVWYPRLDIHRQRAAEERKRKAAEGPRPEGVAAQERQGAAEPAKAASAEAQKPASAEGPESAAEKPSAAESAPGPSSAAAPGPSSAAPARGTAEGLSSPSGSNEPGAQSTT